MAHYRLIAARADALFASNMSAGSYPTVAEVRTAIRQALRAHGGTGAAEARSQPPSAITRS